MKVTLPKGLDTQFLPPVLKFRTRCESEKKFKFRVPIHATRPERKVAADLPQHSQAAI